MAAAHEPFDASKPVEYTQPLKAIKRNAMLVPSLRVFSADIGPDNFCYWVGRYNAAEQRIETLSWPRFSLLGDTASSRWAYMTEAVLTDQEAARCSDYMIEQQKPINAISKHAENIGAYGLSAALGGALCAATRLRPLAARRIFVRSPMHKFHVLGIECPKKKLERKKLSRRLALNYLVRCEPTKNLAWRVWLANSDKQDDMADAMVSGMAYLIELDEQSPQPKLTAVKRALLGLAPHEKLPSKTVAPNPKTKTKTAKGKERKKTPQAT